MSRHAPKPVYTRGIRTYHGDLRSFSFEEVNIGTMTMIWREWWGVG